ncbi:MAG TPA: cytochrome P450 [Myxococcota bacterium]|nr:cytochrome P450 [Myxococcota bacterium]
MLEYHPYAEEIFVDPYPIYRRMRAEQPAYYVEEYEAWFLSRFEDIWKVGPDFQHFSALQGTTPNHLLTKDTPLNLSFASMDPPQHSKYRAQVSEHFKPGTVAKLEAKMAAIVKGLVDDFIERGECDLVQDLAARVSVRAALATGGLPLSIADTASGWVNGIFHRRDGHRGATEVGQKAMREMFFAILEHVKEARKNPEKAEGVLRTLLTTDVGGDKMDDFRIASLLSVVLIGGTDTLPKALAATFYRLWKNPDQRRELARDRSLVQDAFLEGLRIDTPTQHLGRTVTKEIDFHGNTFRPGQRVMLMWASANRDEREFQNPDVYDMKRRPPRMLAFGHGVHMCLGKHIALMEARLTLDEVMRRIPEYEIDLARAERTRTEFVQGWVKLPATFTPAR